MKTFRAAEKQEKMGVLVDYFYHNLNAHNLWAASYLLCEIFSFVNIIGTYISKDLIVTSTDYMLYISQSVGLVCHHFSWSGEGKVRLRNTGGQTHIPSAG